MVTLQNNLTFLCLYCRELCRKKKGKIAWHNGSGNSLFPATPYLNIFLRTLEPARALSSLYGVFVCAKLDMTEIQLWIGFLDASTVLIKVGRITLSQ